MRNQNQEKSKDFYLKLKKQYFDKSKKPNGEIKNPIGGKISI